MKLPAKFATTIENKILILTTIAIFKFWFNSLVAAVNNKKMNTKIKVKIPTIIPLINPTLNSLKIILKMFLLESSSSVSTLIVTANDCVPQLPAISKIKDWKTTIIGIPATTFSNCAINNEVTNPRPRSINSHGILFLTDLKMGSFKSSSPDRPPSLA